MRTFICIPLALTLAACQAAPAEPPAPPPEPAPAATPEPKATAAAPATATQTAAPVQRPERKPPGADDPLAGKFTLVDATEGLSGKGGLIADIQTELGKLECELFDDKAPITVANFVGLARGLRPFKSPAGEWLKKPAYDGTTFHRVIKGFMIQGGDPAGTGGGEPGYVIPDENWEGAAHDRRGLLCMANRGKNTNGMQFFITDGAPRHLDGGYTIFGECRPGEVIEKLSSVEVRGDRSVKPTKIQKVTIRRGKVKADKPTKTTEAGQTAPAAAKPAAAPAAPAAAPAPAGSP
jgi:peptidyl-prolyl cis-trans isomerase A (cyclophilin A)